MEEIKIIKDNYGDYITYRKLYAYLEERPFYLESLEETVNRDEADEIEKNPEINENNIMCERDSFKGLKTLCCYFWSKEITGQNESDWIDPKYLSTNFSKDEDDFHCIKDTFESFKITCLKDAFDYFGITLVIKTKYDDCINELTKGGKYYSAWIICGNGGGKLPGGGEAKLVGQFIEVLHRFWSNGGALVFWCDNFP